MADRDERLADRVATLERTITDGHADGSLPDAARMGTRLDDLETTVAELDDRLSELDAAVQALRGFAGGVRAVDEAVERQADAAVARVDRLETELHDVREELRSSGGGTVGTDTTTGRGGERDGTGTATRHDTHDESRGERTARSGRAMHGPSDAGDCGDGTHYRESGTTPEGSSTTTADGRVRQSTVAARTDAALAEAAAMADESEEVETDEERSLAERIRRLL